MTRDKLRKEVQAKAELAPEERVLDALVGDTGNDLFEKEFIYAKVCEALTRS